MRRRCRLSSNLLAVERLFGILSAPQRLNLSKPQRRREDGRAAGNALAAGASMVPSP